MTFAACLRCGAFKHGAFNACNGCGFRPADDYDKAYFLALTGVPLAWNLAGGYQEPLRKVVDLHVQTMRAALATEAKSMPAAQA